MNAPKRNRKKQISLKAISAGLSDKELAFCELYANSSTHRGNGVQCYAEAFGLNLANPGSYNSARVNASKLLTNVDVLKYIQSIFENDGLSEAAVLGELAFCVKQNADFGSKVAAIKLCLEVAGKLRKHDEPQLKFQINVIPAGQNRQAEPKESSFE
jgi:hypothetical protein